MRDPKIDFIWSSRYVEINIKPALLIWAGALVEYLRRAPAKWLRMIAPENSNHTSVRLAGKIDRLKKIPAGTPPVGPDVSGGDSQRVTAPGAMFGEPNSPPHYLLQPLPPNRGGTLASWSFRADLCYGSGVYLGWEFYER